MTIEARPISQIIEPNKEEINFRNKIREWVQNEISYEELLEHYPTYLLSVPERVVKFVRGKISQITRRGEAVE